MKIVLLGLVLTLTSSFAMAEHLQCRGVDGHKEQIVVQVNDIQRSAEGAQASLRVMSLYLFGRKDLCKSARISGAEDKTNLKYGLVVECDSQNTLHEATVQGAYALQLARTGSYTYKGTFCQGQGRDHEIAGVSFGEQSCLNLQCSLSRK